MAGAGPYLAACAHALPDRVRVVGMAGVFSPFDAPGVRGTLAARRRLVHQVLSLAPRAPGLVRAIGAARIQRAMNVELADCDKQVVARVQERFAAMKREAFRQGPEAFAWDLALAARPWGFRIEDIRVPVHLWHGELDASAPPAMGRYLAATIPGCRARFLAEHGHFIAYAIWPEIVRTLRASFGQRGMSDVSVA
jgi:pimeloyl-ACP methyl ester carboxylesterase